MKAYIITIKNKLMNKIPYRYTTKLLSRTIGGSVGGVSKLPYSKKITKP